MKRFVYLSMAIILLLGLVSPGINVAASVNRAPVDPHILAQDVTARTSFTTPSTPITMALPVLTDSFYNVGTGYYDCPSMELSNTTEPGYGTLDTNAGSGWESSAEGCLITFDVIYTAGESYPGSDSFDFTISTTDLVFSDTGTVTIVANQPPVAPDGMAAIRGWDYSTYFSMHILPDPDGDPLEIAGVNQTDTTYGTISAGNTSCYEPTDCDAYFYYTLPAVMPDPSFETEILFTYQLSDGVDLSNWADGTLKVGDIPEAFDKSMMAANNYPNSISLEGNDGTDDQLDFQILTEPAFGTVTPPVNSACPSEGPLGSISRLELAEGASAKKPAGPYDWHTQAAAAPSALEPLYSCATVSYTPDSGYTGEDSFTFVVNDGSMDSLPATIRLNVQVEVTSTAFDGIAAITQAQLGSGAPKLIMLTAYDPNVVFLGEDGFVGDNLTFSIATQPANGTITTPSYSDCEYTETGMHCHAIADYTPTSEGWTGDSFTFTVNDGFTDSSPGKMSLILRDGTLALTVNATDDVVDDYGCDENHCSLREAVQSSISGDSLSFDLETPATIALQMGRIRVNHGITITGPGADLLTISGSETGGVFEFNDWAYQEPISSSLSGLTIRDGRGQVGAAIRNEPNSTLALEDCYIGPNNIVTYAGGGIFNFGVMTMNRCTVAGNHGTGSEGGAGIYTSSAELWGGPAGSLTLVNSTISGNVTNNFGGGIYAYIGDVSLIHSTVTANIANADHDVVPRGGGGGILNGWVEETTVTLQNSIIAGNTDLTDATFEHTPSPNFSGTVNSLGGNLIGDDRGSTGWIATDLVGTSALPINPMLDVLSMNEPGSTPTHALLAGSPAIDAVDCLAEVTTDQRGVARPQGSACDIGAYEAQLQHISLVTGWNLVSSNLDPVNTSIANVLSSISGQYSLVYAWNAATSSWRIYDPTLGDLNDLKNLDESMGFWIKVNSDQMLTVSGSMPGNTPIELKNGWNLVGYPSAVNRALPDVLRDHGVGTDFSLVYAYHANEGGAAWKLFDRAGNPLLNDLTELAPGWGYWIKTSADQTWTVP